jgi:hypothetical protein
VSALAGGALAILGGSCEALGRLGQSVGQPMRHAKANADRSCEARAAAVKGVAASTSRAPA